MARPKKDADDKLVGRAGKIVIKQEEEKRVARKWQRRRETIKRFAAKK
jgi:hypothetical protein